VSPALMVTLVTWKALSFAKIGSLLVVPSVPTITEPSIFVELFVELLVELSVELLVELLVELSVELFVELSVELFVELSLSPPIQPENPTTETSMTKTRRIINVFDLTIMGPSVKLNQNKTIHLFVY
jgi:hypothetical protein